MRRPLVSLSLLVLALAGCSTSAESAPSTEAPTSSASSTTNASSSTSATPSSSAETTGADVAADATSVEDAAAGCGTVGITKAPGHEAPHCLDKAISSCAPANGVYEFGTTFFTDGTSGWTQQCDGQMRANFSPPTQYPAYPAEPTFDQDAYNRQFAEDYWATHPKPTFDPNSADGYGPNQVLPPACLRLQGVNC